MAPATSTTVMRTAAGMDVPAWPPAPEREVPAAAAGAVAAEPAEAVAEAVVAEAGAAERSGQAGAPALARPSDTLDHGAAVASAA